MGGAAAKVGAAKALLLGGGLVPAAKIPGLVPGLALKKALLIKALLAGKAIAVGSAIAKGTKGIEDDTETYSSYTVRRPAVQGYGTPTRVTKPRVQGYGTPSRVTYKGTHSTRVKAPTTYRGTVGTPAVRHH